MFYKHHSSSNHDQWSDLDLFYGHTCDISLFRRELPIFYLFLRKSPYESFQNFLYILYISLFGISDLPTKIQEFPSLFNHSPYLEKEMSLFVFWDVSHVCLWQGQRGTCVKPVFWPPSEAKI